MGFNLKAIRDLNTFKVYNGSQPLAKFYTNKGWDYNFELNTTDAWGSFRDIVSGYNVVKSMLQAGGITTAIDIPRKYVFNGTQPLSVTVPCFLILENDPNEDLLKPLNALINYIMPKHANEKKSSTEIKNRILDWEGKQEEKLGGSGVIHSVLEKTLNLLDQYLGEFWVLEAPDAFKLENLNQTNIIWGGRRITDVFIKSVRVTTPKFYYSTGVVDADLNGERPIPDRIDVEISFETARIVTRPGDGTNYFQNY